MGGRQRQHAPRQHRHDNARNGIYAFGATENTFEANKMFGNAILDARDDARDRNIWNANQCVTDFPADSICGFVQP